MSDGTGRDEAAAHAVVEEIRGFGGEAVAHFGDVADWNDAQSLIRTSIERFGDLHVLVNNAGFLRDAVLFNMTERDFDDVIRVHLKGHFCTMRFASAYWRETAKRGGGTVYGRLISTSSESAIFCPPGQPNYSAAKAGIVALTMGAAQLMQKYGVTANVIMPRARTRMNDSGLLAAMFKKPDEGFDTFAPENVAPLVGYLASPAAARISGHVLVVWARQVKLLSQLAIGTVFDSEERWTVAALNAQLTPHFEKLEPVVGGFAMPPG
jgi:3-oxoacyl-[acyl-carrier protein] reductase